MTKPTPPAAIAARLSAKDRIALFCAAADIDHATVGILASTMHTMEICGLIARAGAAGRYVLTDTGRAVFGALLGPAAPAGFCIAKSGPMAQ